jgi:hypothetical protein
MRTHSTMSGREERMPRAAENGMPAGSVAGRAGSGERARLPIRMAVRAARGMGPAKDA